MEERDRNLPPTWLGVAVFILSGFAGLVYEATWSRYLKGVLGHEAYAQALVLGIFLGGLAAGSALAGRRVSSYKSPLIGYAAIEAVLAVAAIYFHDLFVVVRGTLEGGLGTSGQLARWLAMVAMILPQSILLGATFPLLAAALTRSSPRDSGKTVSALYFANSFGGVFGSLAVGFFLVDFGGLPGSMYAGGIASAAAGVAAWIAHHRYDSPAPVTAAVVASGRKVRPGLLPYLVVAAFGTGLASLVYEIVWVRMLALVLGSSTRAFEIMLATFILGLALGSLFVRQWTDRSDRLRKLAWAQLLMGTSVVVTMFAYEGMFAVMSDIRHWLPLTKNGYSAYGAACFLLSLALMFAPTFFAGMTLPLLTREAMETQGERSLGMIYAWNTLGAIAGILLALHVLMPVVGLKHALTFGLAVDLALGAMFLRLAQPRMFARVIVASVAIVAIALAHSSFDPKVLNSSPYRFGHVLSPDTEVLFTKHGKTSTVSVVEVNEDDMVRRAIFNNGKSDGALLHEEYSGSKHVGDTYTNIIAVAIALMHKPDARRAGVIGLGTGYTAESMLLSDAIETVETMEIEPGVIEGVGYFTTGEALRNDPRSKLIQIDAKAHMASKPPGSYDIIVSIPSHPWVSGVSSLFSVEHFGQMRRALADDGVLVQWFHVYESNPQSVASILAAAAQVFPDYMLFSMNHGDVAIVATPDHTALGEIDSDVFARLPRLEERLHEFDVRSVNDIRSLVIGDKELLEPYFDTFGIGANSDYFPILDRYSGLGVYQRTYYTLNLLAENFGHLLNSDVLPTSRLREPFASVSSSRYNSRLDLISQVTALLDDSVPLRRTIEEFVVLNALTEDAKTLVDTLFDESCSDVKEVSFGRVGLLADLMAFASSFLYPEETSYLWERIVNEVPCLESLRSHETHGKMLAYIEADSNNDPEALIESVRALIGEDTFVSKTPDVIALTKMMLALMDSGKSREAIKESLRLHNAADVISKHAIRLVGAHAFTDRYAKKDGKPDRS